MILDGGIPGVYYSHDSKESILFKMDLKMNYDKQSKGRSPNF